MSANNANSAKALKLTLVLFLFLLKNEGCTRLFFVNSSGYRTGRSA
jgi:hypothetical protein